MILVIKPVTVRNNVPRISLFFICPLQGHDARRKTNYVWKQYMIAAGALCHAVRLAQLFFRFKLEISEVSRPAGFYCGVHKKSCPAAGKMVERKVKFVGFAKCRKAILPLFCFCPFPGYAVGERYGILHIAEACSKLEHNKRRIG